MKLVMSEKEGDQNMIIRFEFKHGGFIECEIDVDQSWDQVATKIYESDLVIGEHDDCTVGFAFQTNELKSIRRVH